MQYPDLFYAWFVEVLPSIVRLGLKDYPTGAHCSDVWKLLSLSLPRNYNLERIVPNYNDLVKQSILQGIQSILDSDDTWHQYRILQQIYEFLQAGDLPSPGSMLSPTFTFAWDSLQALILDIMEPSLQRIVKIAMSSYGVTGSGVAQDIIRRMSESGEFGDLNSTTS